MFQAVSYGWLGKIRRGSLEPLAASLGSSLLLVHAPRAIEFGVAPSVLGHRLVLSPEAEGDPKLRDQIVEEALSRIGYRRQARPA